MNIAKINPHYIPIKLKQGKNGSSKSPDMSSVISDTVKELENHFKLQMQEMEEQNAHLEKLVELRTKELTKVAETKAKYISIIAHDLRSPFCSIILALEFLKENLNNYNKNDIKNFINEATHSANKTLDLLDDLLTWAISQNKEKSFNPVKINLSELMTDEIESIHTSAKQKQITLNHSIPPDLNVAADLQMVKTILRNLISNAIKFTNSGGQIRISASEIPPFVDITVRDNGIGISSEAQIKLFRTDGFHSTAGTHNEQGTGLGLLLCKEFVEIHGGNIRIESEPGKGSEFKFTLPHYI
jgi:signal transduction histidine kinase